MCLLEIFIALSKILDRDDQKLNRCPESLHILIHRL